MPILKPGEPTFVQVLPGSVETVVRCKIGGLPSPMKLHINYPTPSINYKLA